MAPKGLAVLEDGDDEAGELARDCSMGPCSGRGPEGLIGGTARLASLFMVGRPGIPRAGKEPLVLGEHS